MKLTRLTMWLEALFGAVLAVLLFARKHLLQLCLGIFLDALVALALVMPVWSLEPRADLGSAAVYIAVLPCIWYIVPAVKDCSALASGCLLSTRSDLRFVLDSPRGLGCIEELGFLH